MPRLLCTLGFLWVNISFASISIHLPESLSENPIPRLAIEDVTALLKQACNCPVEWNAEKADIRILLPQIDPAFANQPTRFEKGKPYPILHYPEQDYSWESKDSAGIIALTLNARTVNAISFGLYGLLQEKLGFQFYHPREMIVPHWEQWPLPSEFKWTATARFHKMGFHLHTQHPLELTEDLMSPYTDAAKNRIKEYIDWLARNQQNYFEFNLLESIHLPSWVEHYKPVIEYGHQRGIIMGVDLSLHMIQQKAFMLYQSFPASWRTKKKQIDRNLKKLCEADWDVFDVEFSTTEFTKGNEKKKKKLQLHLTDRLVNKYGVKPMGRMHVVKKDELLDSGNKKDFGMTAEDSLLDSHRGILIHTVMFYSMLDEKAPVYQNENLNHMLEALLHEQKLRETWYYPESAYWITFDNSVPMFLMPYLSARLDDILMCDSLDVNGHITFSSGWEWGYWLFDWSIARWSWKHEQDGKIMEPKPTQFISAIFNEKQLDAFFEEALQLQQHYLKDKGAIQYMTAQTVTDELPSPFNLQLHPRPELTYQKINKNSDTSFIEQMKQEDMEYLLRFAAISEKLSNAMESNFPKLKSWSAGQAKVFHELLDGIRITILRSKQRISILHAMTDTDPEMHLEKAEELRLEALEIVKQRESNYRYPVSLLASPYYSHTSYNYGYLYPVHDLHFWKREEMQIRKNRWGPLFMSIWNVTRIVGLTN